MHDLFAELRLLLGLVLSERDNKVYKRIDEQFSPMSDVIKSRLDLQSVLKLVAIGVAQISAVTPSDSEPCTWKIECLGQRGSD